MFISEFLVESVRDLNFHAHRYYGIYTTNYHLVLSIIWSEINIRIWTEMYRMTNYHVNWAILKPIFCYHIARNCNNYPVFIKKNGLLYLYSDSSVSNKGQRRTSHHRFRVHNIFIHFNLYVCIANNNSDSIVGRSIVVERRQPTFPPIIYSPSDPATFPEHHASL